jgi:hypothetical protein
VDVVDDFEIVDVAKGDGQRRVVNARAFGGRPQFAFKGAAVVQTRELVGFGTRFFLLQIALQKAHCLGPCAEFFLNFAGFIHHFARQGQQLGEAFCGLVRVGQCGGSFLQ